MWMRACILALTIGASAQTAEKTFALRECEREISERRQEYTVAYEEEAISEDFYEAVTSFLEETQKNLTSENCVEAYSDFVDDYQDLLRQYPKEAIIASNDNIHENETLGIVEQTRREYNLDMCYIQKELKIYGEYVDFELSEEEFEEALLTVTEDNKEESNEKSN